MPNKKIIFLVGFVWAALLSVMGQQSDSLWIRTGLNEAEAALEMGDTEAAFALVQALLTKSISDFPELEIEAQLLLGEAAQVAGNYPLAIVHLDSAYCFAQDALAVTHPLRAEALSQLGNYYYELGYIPLAFDHHQQALYIRQSFYGLQHPETAKSLNNLANCYFSYGMYDQAQVLYEQVLQVRQQSKGITTGDLAAAFNNLGNLYLAIGQLDRASMHAQQALVLRQQAFGKKHLKTAQSHQNVGNCFAGMQVPDSALIHFEKALPVYLAHYGENHPKLAALYENMGNARAAKQQYLAADALLEQALDIRRSYYGFEHPDMIRSYQNIGELWMLRGDYHTALSHFRQAFHLLREREGDYSPSIAQAYEQMGLAEMNTGAYDSAKNHLSVALSLRESIFGPDHPFVAGTALNMGHFFWQQKAYAQAREYYEKSLAIWLKLGEDWRSERLKTQLSIASTYLEEGHLPLAENALQHTGLLEDNDELVLRVFYLRCLANLNYKKGWYEQADAFLEQALQVLGYDPSAEVFSVDVLLCLELKGKNRLDWASTQQNALGLQQALQYLEEAMSLLSEAQRTYLNPEARQQLTGLNQSLFEAALKACFVLADLSDTPQVHYRKAFVFSERTKGNRLSEANALYTNTHNRQADSVVAHLQKSMMAINRLEKERVMNPKNDKERQLLEAQLFQEQKRQANLYHQLNNLEQGRSIVSSVAVDEVQPLQQALGNQEAMISFFYGSDAVFMFLLQKEEIYAFQLDPIFPWEAAILGMGKSILRYPMAASSDRQREDSIYCRHARALYDAIFAPILPYLESVESLIIVPDGIMGWLAFESLLTDWPEESQRYRSYPFLIHRFNISYAYSAGWWFQLKERLANKKGIKQQCLAIAPDFSQDERGFPPLDYNQSEVSQIIQLIGGKKILGTEAIRSQFLTLAPQYAILHLATHAKANIYDGDYAFLAFYAGADGDQEESLLYVKDLYAHWLNAEMVVLSACETGAGSFQPGEGVIHLGRGFAHAGVRSTINSLWQINDARTAVLMLEFYKNLKAEMPKNSALRQAKIRYLAESSHEAAHPFYWASYLPYGDMKPLVLQSVGRYYWWIGGGALVLLLIGFYWRKRQKRHDPI
ncbi:MAG TPA: CHAT domain-containing protein [Saprospiraceae bacterium]|nr:CHAT domain-containing protein [Saprospiraceae bacterium]HMQ81573.1 CHAT domain-containing protein [Saprospiraceae bacterium]